MDMPVTIADGLVPTAGSTRQESGGYAYSRKELDRTARWACKGHRFIRWALHLCENGVALRVLYIDRETGERKMTNCAI